jgi:hypothetical protein
MSHHWKAFQWKQVNIRNNRPDARPKTSFKNLQYIRVVETLIGLNSKTWNSCKFSQFFEGFFLPWTTLAQY